MGKRAYFDWNASAPLRSQARAAMLDALETVGNPSSVHTEGRGARQVIEVAREQVASLVGATSHNVIFTSGGTEANALALNPSVGCAEVKRSRLLVSAVEHPSVLCGGRFAAEHVQFVPVTASGTVDLEALGSLLAGGQDAGSVLVSIMAANNETGVVQRIAAVAEIVHAAGALLHVDAVQVAGRIECNINDMGADLLTVSAHKLGGPKGTGALIKASRELHFFDPLIRGGGQERGCRAGTENVAAIAGFGAAAAAASQSLAEEAGRTAALRLRLEAGLRAISPEIVIFGAGADRLPNTTLFAIPGCQAGLAVIAFDLEGIAVSSGAACSSGKVTASHVLAAMGIPADLAAGAVRASLGWATTDAEVECFLEAWRNIFLRLSSKGKSGLAA